MNKKLIRLTESDLHKIVKESVERILNEGKYTNNNPYFGNATQYVRGDSYFDSGGFERDLGYADTEKPKTEYARSDKSKEPSYDSYLKLRKYPNQEFEFTDEEGYPTDPENQFDAAGRLHTLRQMRKADFNNQEFADGLTKQARLTALRNGVPKNVVRKLSRNTLSIINKELGGI